MSKPFTHIQIQAAELVAKGIPDVEIASTLQKSRHWLRQLKKSPEFMELVNEFTQKYKQTIISGNQEIGLKGIRDCFDRQCYARDLLFDTANLLMEKLIVRLKSVDPEELKANQLFQSLKQVAETYKVALDIDSSSIGLDHIFKEIQEIKELGNIKKQ